MDPIEEWFPYPSYRPHQRSMLDMAAKCAREGGIGMIDAPTGYGKSSVVTALLSEANGRKVIIAVRTISQLTTFLKELSLIRSKKPDLKFSYLIGKANACPMHGNGDVYRRCEALKALSLSLMKGRAREGSLNPSRDRIIQTQMRHNSKERPLLCPYYIGSKVFMEGDEGLRLISSSLLRTLAHRVITEVITPDRLFSLCRDTCPYEVLLQAARGADVLIVNFHHIFDEEVRSQIYASAGIEPRNTLLLIDEAHNCADAIQSAQSMTMERSWLEEAAQELGRLRRRGRQIGGLLEIIAHLLSFIGDLQVSEAVEDILDSAGLTSFLLRGTLYNDLQDPLEELLQLSEEVRDKKMESGDFRISGVERLTNFLYGVHRAYEDRSFMVLFQKEGEKIVLEVRNIDPGPRLAEIASLHGCCLLISGTFSPIEGFRRYYFPDAQVTTLVLPSIFPRENRLVICASDVTTAFSMRDNEENNARISRYISTLSRCRGNLAIYFPSYQMLDRYSSTRWSSGSSHRIFIEPRDPVDAAVALREFLSLPDRGEEGIMMAVCGGKWSEGLDYRGEQLAGAMVIGLPLSPFNRVRRKINDYFRAKFGAEGEFLSYTVPAINRALQAIGRVIRTPEDRGVLVLTDRRYLEPRIRSALPSWVQDEMRISTIGEFRDIIRGWR
ncbi:MAG: ATP-dependent DNA helicase [Methanomicrobiales archaeon]|nr:ATP-dependent DNA helicase [Methanomicrobiales archaeon]